MNILFFLTPKSEVAYISEDDTLRQALEKMEHHKYSSVPIISRKGRYIGTLTEGDLLWGIKNQFNLSLKEAEKIPITAIRRRCDNLPVKADADDRRKRQPTKPADAADKHGQKVQPAGAIVGRRPAGAAGERGRPADAAGERDQAPAAGSG